MSPRHLPPWITHPVTAYLLQVALSAGVIGFTSSRSLLRPALAPAQFYIAWLAYQHLVDGRLSVFTTSSVFLAILANPLMYIEKTLISRWDFDAGGPTRSFNPGAKAKTRPRGLGKKEHRGSCWARVRFGFDTASSARHLNTPYEVKNAPHFSSGDKTDVPSRAAYLWRSLAMALVCYAILDLAELGERMQPPEAAALLTPENAPLFSRLDEVTAPELISRFITVFMVPVNTWCIINVAYNSFGFISVATGLSGVNEWRPPFGSIMGVYTLQQFWGSFWHQLLRIPLFRPGAFLLHGIFGLPSSSIFLACIKMFFAFFMSGVIHTIFDLACHHPLEKSGALRFFCMQALGISAEAVVQAAWERMLGHGSRKGSRPASNPLAHTPPAMWKRAVGLGWFVGFMVWTVPGWMYIHVSEHHTRILPFSVIDWLLAEKLIAGSPVSI